MPVDERNDVVTHPSLTEPAERVCRVCGCSDNDACYHDDYGNCYWVEKDLCSHCKYFPGEATRWSKLDAEANEE